MTDDEIFAKLSEIADEDIMARNPKSIIAVGRVLLAAGASEGQAERKLDKPAQVSGARFGKGVKWSTVIGAAQRYYDFMQTPKKEALRIENARSFIEGIHVAADASEPCEHEWKAMTDPHKECFKCGDVRRDWNATGASDKPMTDAQIAAGWRQTFSTDNPYCPCNLKSFTKAVRWAERAKESK